MLKMLKILPVSPQAATSSNVILFSCKNNNEVIDMLRLLLDKANDGNLVGLAGVFFMKNGDSGTYATGSACENSAETVVELIKLQNIISN